MKALIKVTGILILAVFQLSFFLNPQTNKSIHRKLAQEVADSDQVSVRINGRLVDPSFLYVDESAVPAIENDTPAVEDEDEDEGGVADLIPEDMPPTEDVRQALINYNTKKDQCLVREEDRLRMTRLLEGYNDARRSGNQADKALAFYELANKLIAIGLLDHEFQRPTSRSSSDDDSRFDVDLEDLDTETASAGSGLLDLNVNRDLEQFQQCHLAVMRDRSMTEAEQKAYYDNTIAPILADNLRGGIASTADTAVNGNNFYAVAQQADALTGNQLGLQYGAQAHGQAAISINAQLAEITRLQNILKVNPGDQATQTLLGNKFVEIEASLRGISENLKAQARTALASNPEALASAEANIDFAVGYWAQETIKIANGEPSTSLLAYSGTTTPSVSNPIPIAGGVTPTIFTDAYLNGTASPTANYDPSNPMLLPPTAFANGTANPSVANNGIRNSDALQRGSDAPQGFTPVIRNRPIRQ